MRDNFSRMSSPLHVIPVRVIVLGLYGAKIMSNFTRQKHDIIWNMFLIHQS